MLKLVVGRAGTGKTKYITDSVVSFANQNQNVMLIVPEQISFLYEKNIEKQVGPNKADFVSVFNFKKLCFEIFKQTGFVARRRIDDEIRTALVKRAIASVGSELSLFGKKKDTVSFCSLISYVLSELKNSGVTPEKVLEISTATQQEISRIKLLELSKIFFAYENIVSNKYQDPSDQLYSASLKAKQCDVFCGKHIMFDGFSGFTAPEKSLLLTALEQAKSVTVTFCCSENLDDNRFETVSNSAKALKAFAVSNNIPVEFVPLNQKHRFKTKGLFNLETFIYEGESSDEREGVFSYHAQNISDEVQVCAAEIVRLVREEQTRFSDITVAVRDLSQYKLAFKRTFEMYDIPFFCDFGETARYSAVANFLKCCFDIIDKPNIETFSELVKTGLFPVSDLEQNDFLNYVYVWGLSLLDLENELTYNPSGLSDNQLNDVEKQQLFSINETAKALYRPVRKLIDSCKNKPANVVIKNILSLVEKFEFKKNIETSLSDQDIMQNSLALEAVEKLYDITNNEVVPAAELKELYTLLLSVTEDSDIPKTLEQVQIGTADRMRADNPKIVFCLGLNSSVFPREQFDPQFLTFKERDIFFENGIDLALRFENSVSLEDVFFYRTLTYPTDRIYLFSSKLDSSKSPLERTAYLAEFFKEGKETPPPVLNDTFAFSVNRKTFEREVSSIVSKNKNAKGFVLENALLSNEYKQNIKTLFEPVEYKLENSETLDKLYPKTLSISPSKVEQFSTCRFRYFLNYTLKLRPIKKAEMSPLETGSFFHAIIESVMKKSDLNLSKLSIDEIKQLAKTSGDEYLEKRLGKRFANDARIKFLCELMITQAERLLIYMQKEMEQSEFRAFGVEVSTARGGDSPPLVLKAQNGATIYIEGKVDRVDIFEEDGKKYIRVIDYKSSKKSFSLDDVAVGINLQMLIYLFSLRRANEGEFRGANVGGVLYFPLDPSPTSSNISAETAYRMEGLVLDQSSVISAMERDGNGIFIPVTLKADGTPNKRGSSLSSLKRFDAIEKHVVELLYEMAKKLYDGNIDAEPIEKQGETNCCNNCDYPAVCKKSELTKRRQTPKNAAVSMFPNEEEIADELDR